jgi:hypothetical protein
VETFLLSDKTKLPESLHGFALELQKAQEAVAFRFLECLNQGTDGKFLDYATMKLLYQVNKAWDDTADVPVPQYFLELFGSPASSAFLNWRREQHKRWDWGGASEEEIYPTPLYAVSTFGSFKLASAILD